MIGELRLRVYSPLVIREGNNVREYLIDYIAIGKEIYVLSKDKFLRKLLEKGILDEFSQIADKIAKATGVSEVILELKRFYEKHGFLNAEFLRDVSLYSIKTSLKLEEMKLKQIGYLVRDLNGRIYIPGSSIKGAIRTSILYGIITSNSKNIKELRRILLIKLKQRRKLSPQKIARDIEDRFLCGMYKIRERPIPEAQRDLLRGLIVSDGKPLPENSASVIMIKLLEDSKERDLTLVEAINPGIESIHEIKLDDAFLDVIANRMKLSDRVEFLHKLPEVINNFYLEVLKHEMNYAKKMKWSKLETFYIRLRKEIERDKDSFLIRIGWGSGWISTTIGLILKNYLPDLMSMIRRTLKMGIRGKDFPLSRKVSHNYEPLGWCIGKIAWKS